MWVGPTAFHAPTHHLPAPPPRRGAPQSPSPPVPCCLLLAACHVLRATSYMLRAACCAQTAEDYMEVILARLDQLRHAALSAGAGSGAVAAAAVVPPAPTSPAAVEAVDRLRACFSEASELMVSYFPDYVDRALRVPAYRARCEAFVAGDVAAARGVWEATLKGPMGR